MRLKLLNSKIESVKLIKLFGETSVLNDEVKRLGLIVDFKLIWKAYVDGKYYKPLKFVWHCRRIKEKVWSIKTDITKDGSALVLLSAWCHKLHW